MIHIYLTGRLGNQMFQYACARKLQEQYGLEIVCNLYELKHVTKKLKHVPGEFMYDLKDYALNSNIKIEDKKLPWYVQFSNPFIRLIKKICPEIYFKLLSKFGLLAWQREDYIELPLLKNKEILLNGWWQDIRYFEGISDILRKEFIPIYDRLDKNLELYDLIKNKNSVCVSIRGGNYLVPKVKEKLFVCDKEYFYSAIEKISMKLENPLFIVFSDDIEWVKTYMKFEEKFSNMKFIYESGEDPVWEKLRLMSECKHFIISNSTFSWWAQYLSDNVGKIVYAPSKWFTNGNKCGLYEPTWNLIDIERLNKNY